jgi:hypothetical protein
MNNCLSFSKISKRNELFKDSFERAHDNRFLTKDRFPNLSRIESKGALHGPDFDK